MKKYLIILALFAIFSSCKKDKPVTPSITGTWELKTILASITITVEDKDKETYVFTADNRYIKTAADKTQTSGTFVLKLTGEQDGRRYGNITFSDTQKTEVITFKGDDLVIGDSSLDMPSYRYARVKKASIFGN
ncbi:MAG: hypothetical protein JKY70_20295 [Mucilaginibacter sp.]|nr:hypothetical protein [Mucilaginibacter sp.]